MCLNMQISALEIDLGAKVVADLMCNTEILNTDNASIVADCRLLISQFPPKSRCPTATVKLTGAPML